jgi:hypothetical protein
MSRAQAAATFGATASRVTVAFTVFVLGLLCSQCGRRHDTLIGPTDLPRSVAAPLLDGVPAPEFAGPEIFVGAGDIGLCHSDGNPEATARLLDRVAGTVFTLGDNAQVLGTTEEFRDCYGPTWGRHRGRTRPAPGNHDYETPGAVPYFDYFGPHAGPAGVGYYSFDLGAWHVVSLNSNIPVSAGSAQGAWLHADLAASRAPCTLAYWHHPLFSSGSHGNQARMRDFWELLHEAGADIVLSGHDHLYERFAPQDANGVPDTTRGIRQFVVGTGGANLYEFRTIQPNSEMRLRALGVLKLTLAARGYDWEFISVSGPGDFGSDTCH